jgi:hypothetical protein
LVGSILRITVQDATAGIYLKIRSKILSSLPKFYLVNKKNPRKDKVKITSLVSFSWPPRCNGPAGEDIEAG